MVRGAVVGGGWPTFADTPNVTIATLKKIERAMPAIEATHAQQRSEEKQLLDWARQEAEKVGIRPLARRLRTDPANLVKVLAGRRRMAQPMIAAIARGYKTASCA